MKHIFDFFREQKKMYEKDYDLNDFKPAYIGNIDLLNDIINPDNNYYVIVFTDSDSDGISGYVILQEILTSCCIPHYIHISSRKEGYGLNNERLKTLLETFHSKKELDYKPVLFTCDLGIANKVQVDYAKEIGYDKVIITDHHTVDYDNLPNADLIVNMKLQEDEKLYLCGAGLVYMLYRDYATQRAEIFAGNATIVDMVPIQYGSINRTIVKNSIDILRNKKIEDIKTLYFLNKAIYKFGETHITESAFGFGIGPMLNSLSRMGKQDVIKAYFDYNKTGENEVLEEIYETNSKRKIIQSVYEENVVKMMETCNIDKDKINIFILPYAISSIVGLTASFILSKYGIDNICLAPTDNPKQYKGSGRSKKFHIYNFVKKLQQEFGVNGGGHSNAVGMSVSSDNLEKLLEKYNVDKLAHIELIPVKSKQQDIYEITYDELIDNNIKNLLEYFSPYGMDNPPPLLQLNDLKVVNVKKKGSHVFLTCELPSDINSFETPTLEVLVFKEYNQEKYKKNITIDVIGVLSNNSIIAENIIFK